MSIENRSAGYLQLGTANFGSKYGITNSTLLEQSEIVSILDWSFGKIKTLETSLDYTGSIACIADHAKKFGISTKIDLQKIENVKEIRHVLYDLIDKLDIQSFNTVLIRENENIQMSKFRDAVSELEGLVDEGLIEKIGFSLYSPLKIIEYGATSPSGKVFQVPLNLADKKFEIFVKNNWESCSRHTYIARSVFLQGLLLSRPTLLPSNLQTFHKFLGTLRSIAKNRETTVMQICVDYIRRQDWLDSCVIGTNALTQLKEVYEAFVNPIISDHLYAEKLPHLNSDLVDPRLW